LGNFAAIVVQDLLSIIVVCVSISLAEMTIRSIAENVESAGTI
jgi:hypothetical protein